MNGPISLRAVLIAAARLSTSLSTFVLSMVLVRMMSKDEVGSYAQVWLVVNTATSIVAAGLPGSVYYFLPQLPSGQQRLFIGRMFGMLAAFGLMLAVGIGLGAAELARLFHNPSLAPLLRVMAVMAWVNLPFAVTESVMVTLGASRLLAALTLVFRALFFVAAALPLTWGGGLTQVLLGVALHSVLQAGTFVWASMRRVPGGAEVPWSLQVQQLRFCLPLSLNSLVGIVTAQLDKLFVSLLGSARQFAVYWVGAFELPFVGILTGAITDAIVPNLAVLAQEGQWSRFVSLWHQAILRVAVYLFPILVYLLIYSQEFISLLYSRQYAAGALPFALYLMLIPTRLTSFGQVLIALGRPQAILRSSLIALGANAAGMWLSIRFLGMFGAAASTVLVTFLLAGYLLNAIRKSVATTWRKVWPWRDLGRLLGLCTAAVLPTLWTKLLPSSDLVIIGTSGVMYALVLGWLYWRKGWLDTELRLLRGRLIQGKGA